MTALPRILYLPGLDGEFYAGDIVLDGLPECPRAQMGYPAALTDSLDALAHEALDQLNARGWSDAALMGESFGAALAQRVACLAPSRVTHLMLLAGFLHTPSPRLGRVVGAVLRYAPLGPLKLPLRLLGGAVLARGAPADKKKRFLDSLMAAPLRDMGWRLKAIDNFDSRPWAHWRQPTLWMWGKRDRLCLRGQHAAWLNVHRPADHVGMIDGVGHLLPRTAREQVIAAIRRFLDLR